MNTIRIEVKQERSPVGPTEIRAYLNGNKDSFFWREMGSMTEEEGILRGTRIVLENIDFKTVKIEIDNQEIKNILNNNLEPGKKLESLLQQLLVVVNNFDSVEFGLVTAIEETKSEDKPKTKRRGRKKKVVIPEPSVIEDENEDLPPQQWDIED